MDNWPYSFINLHRCPNLRMAKVIVASQNEKEILNCQKKYVNNMYLIKRNGNKRYLYSKFIIMKKHITLLLILGCIFSVSSFAQHWGGGVYVQRGYRRPPPPRRPPVRRNPQQRQPQQTGFKPTVNLSIGYGYPNLDQDQLAQFTDAYQGSISSNGPVTGSFDYQFSRTTSIGLTGTYGKVSAPYYDNFSSDNTPAFTGKLENWSVMLNLVNYFPTRQKTISPYLRTAIGVNNWTGDYLDNDGIKVATVPKPTAFAYQASLGARINLSERAGFYAEAGYGKYIVNGGITLKF